MFGTEDPPRDIDLLEWDETKSPETNRELVGISDAESEASLRVGACRESISNPHALEQSNNFQWIPNLLVIHLLAKFYCATARAPINRRLYFPT